MQDVLIIGGGACGLTLACLLKQQNSKISVTVAEQLERVGKKLSTTGNGRCNITNLEIKQKNFYTRCPDKAHRVVSLFDYEKTKAFFSSIGVEFINEGSKVYPRSLQASSVVDALRFACCKFNVNTLTDCKVLKINSNSQGFTVLCDGDQNITAKCVVVATGGMAGGSKLGSNGDGYSFLKSFGHKIFERTPVIVQVKTENTLTKQLKGVKINCLVRVKNKVETVAIDNGEVLFCDYGLSGPPVLQLSRYCRAGTTLSLDILPEYSLKELKALLINRKTIMGNVSTNEFFAGLIHKKLGQTVIKSCDIPLNINVKSLTEKQLDLVAYRLKNFDFKVEGHTGFINAQATSGGADLEQFSNTLMSKIKPGLFAAGEVLDVDGDCGGYNLQWAWSSAAAVADGIIKYLNQGK